MKAALQTRTVATHLAIFEVSNSVSIKNSGNKNAVTTVESQIIK